MAEEIKRRESFDQLTPKMRQIVETFIELTKELEHEPTYTDVANNAYDTCSTQYASQVLQKQEHIVENRLETAQAEPVADGEGHYDLRLSETVTWKCIRLLPREESREIYNQVKKTGGEPTGTRLDR